MDQKRVLIVLSSHEQVPNGEQETGFSLYEFAVMHNVLKKNGYEIQVASVRGGNPKPVIVEEESNDPTVQSFLQSTQCKEVIENTKSLNELNGQDFVGLCFVGGYGCLFDFPNDPFLDKLGREVFESGGIVGCIGHATIALASIRLSNGQLLIHGKTVTGFTNDEEATRDLVHYLPVHFSNRKTLEDIVDALGGHFSKGIPFALHTCRDGHILTCQNTASVKVFADQFVELLALPVCP